MIAIVSGGQTGVDRGALDAALQVGARCGGWCPRERRAEDGRIPATYPLREMPAGGYPARTRQNVVDSDGTAVITFGRPTGGTALTIREASKQGKPWLIILGDKMTAAEAAVQMAAFVAAHGLDTLNIAGPRASQAPQAYGYAYAVTAELIRDLDRRCR